MAGLTKSRSDIMLSRKYRSRSVSGQTNVMHVVARPGPIINRIFATPSNCRRLIIAQILVASYLYLICICTFCRMFPTWDHHRYLIWCQCSCIVWCQRYFIALHQPRSIVCLQHICKRNAFLANFHFGLLYDCKRHF